MDILSWVTIMATLFLIFQWLCPWPSPKPWAVAGGPRIIEYIGGGEPFVLLFDPITFGSPAGKKEIDVLVNH